MPKSEYRANILHATGESITIAIGVDVSVVSACECKKM